MWRLDNDSAGLQWISGEDAGNSILAYLRNDGAGEQIACIHNFANAAHEGYRLGLPEGEWEEILNSDDLAYGGSGVTNPQLHMNSEGTHGFPQSVDLRIPPLGATFLRRKR